MTNIKKILLIGRSGRGKSTLANVLLNKNNSFEEVFKEGDFSISKTRSIQSAEFKHRFNEQGEEKEFSYYIIDTVGIGDTNLPSEEVLDIISEAIYLARDGVSRVFFVTDGRFDKAEMATYNLLREAIFDQKIIDYTTIIRTRFDGFRNKEECNKDIDSMIEIGDDLAEIITSCQRRIIHVDNPSISLESEELDKKARVRSRTKSREKLLEHLKRNCRSVYNPPNLQELIAKIQERMEKKKKLSEAIDKLKEQLQRSKILLGESIEKELKKDVKILEEKLEREKNAVRQSLFEHVHSKVDDEELKKYLKTNPKKTKVPKEVQRKLDLKFFWEKVVGKINTIAFLKKWRFGDKNPDADINKMLNKYKENDEISKEIRQALQPVIRVKSLGEESELLNETMNKLEKVIKENQKDDLRSYVKKMGGVNVKNILIIGRSGSGKSALANVLMNDFQEGKEFQEFFEERETSISRTKEVKKKDFEWEGIRYLLIGTPGFENTKLLKEDVLAKVKEEIGSVEEINRIFFVIRNRGFSDEEKEALRLLKETFENEITAYVTIVKTEFPSFEDEKSCENDKKHLLNKLKEISELFSDCEVIHVDNPPLNKVSTREFNEGSRQASRAKILYYLKHNCLDNFFSSLQSSENLENQSLENRVEEQSTKK